VSLVEEVTGPETGGSFDARTFLEFLDPSADHWWDKGSDVHSPWVFRGHRETQWKLIPTAARPEEHLSPEFLNVVKAVRSELPNKVHGWSSRSPEVKEKFARVVASARCINHFLRLANDLGIAELGENSSALLSETRLLEQAAVTVLPSEAFGWTEAHGGSVLSSMALAQHHQIPTLLLDWTRDSMAACFFASEGAKGDIAVWAIDGSWIDDWTMYHLEDRLLQKNGLLKFGSPPTFGNKFLAAQSGAFTTIAHHADEINPLEDHLAKLEEALPNFKDDDKLEEREKRAFERARLGKPMLRKIILRASEVVRLKQILFRQRVSKAHLMPTLDNVRTTAMQQLGEIKVD